MTDIHHHITLSISGKRLLPEATKFPEALKALLLALNARFSDAHFHVLTGLADGVDQIAASVFNEHRERVTEKENRWTIGAVMAFSKKDYLLTIENKEEFNRLYNGIAQKLHLDGKYVEGDVGKTQRAKAHRQQGQVLARFGDVLIAAASPKEKGKAGGTLENIVMTLEKGKPVVFYDLDNGRYFLYEKITDWLAGSGEAQSVDQVAQKLHTLLLGRKSVIDVKESAPNKIPDQQEAKKGWVNKMIGHPQVQKILFYLRREIWKKFENRFKQKKEVTAEQTVPLPEEFQPLFGEIERQRNALSMEADKHQTHYRGSYMLNYMASALAIFIAVVAAVYYIFMLKYWPGVYWPLVMLGILKMGIILLIILNTKEANHYNHNRQAINFRYASERLKFNAYVLLGGIFKPLNPTLGRHSRNYLQNNPGEVQYGKIVSELKSSLTYTMEFTPESILAYIEYIKQKWHKGQIDYHRRGAEKYAAIHHRLEHRAEGLSAAVFWIVFAEVIINAFSWPEYLKTALGMLSPILLGCATLFPALVIILISINFQVESKKHSIRYGSMVDQIKVILNDLELAQQAIERKKEEGSVFLAVLGHLDTMGALMIDEVADWSIFYENQVYET